MPLTTKTASKAGLVLYLLIRVLSFCTYTHPFANHVIAGLGIVIFAYWCLKNIKIGWLLLVGELLLDGAGHFFEFQNLLLRTWFLGIFGLVWFIKKIKDRKKPVLPGRPIVTSLIGVAVVIAWSAVHGFVYHHAIINVLQDVVLYFFLFILFPALEFTEATEKPLISLVKTWVVGSALFSLLTLTVYASGLGNLPDMFYHWFRNIAAGKITDLGSHFFRIVLPEHLFVVPIILVLLAFLINQPTQTKQNKKIWALLICSIIILVLNFSRIYFIGLLAGMLVLAFKHSLKRWLTVSTITFISILLTFFSLHFIASRGQSFGLELLGGRVHNAAALQADPSGAIRLAMLPDIYKTIQTHPWFGSGLGATVSYVDPVTQVPVVRTQFDWGYFEMIAELGIIGTGIYMLFIATLAYQLIKKGYASQKNKTSADEALLRGLLAGLVALCVINSTTPALFQGFGILWLVLTIVTITPRDDVSS